MVNKPHKFKDSDIKRVVKSVRAGGVDVNCVKVNPNTGEILVMSHPKLIDAVTGNSWDEVLDAEDPQRVA